jgi:hypothetical protein
MGHIERPPGFETPPPDSPWWVTALKVIGYMIVTVVVLVVVLAGLLFAVCTIGSRH